MIKKYNQVKLFENFPIEKKFSLLDKFKVTWQRNNQLQMAL